MSSNTCEKTLVQTRREGRRLWDITPSPTPRPSPPHKRQRTDGGSTRSTANTPRAREHCAPSPRPAAPPPDPEGGYSLGRAQATRQRHSLPAQQPSHPPQLSRRQQTCQPAEPPSCRPSRTTRPTSPPAEAHHYPLPTQPPPLNVTPNPVEKKPSEPEANGHRRPRQRAPLRPTAPNTSPRPLKPPCLPQPPCRSRSLITSRGTRAAPHNL